MHDITISNDINHVMSHDSPDTAKRWNLWSIVWANRNLRPRDPSRGGSRHRQGWEVVSNWDRQTEMSQILEVQWGSVSFYAKHSSRLGPQMSKYLQIWMGYRISMRNYEVWWGLRLKILQQVDQVSKTQSRDFGSILGQTCFKYHSSWETGVLELWPSYELWAVYSSFGHVP